MRFVGAGRLISGILLVAAALSFVGVDNAPLSGPASRPPSTGFPLVTLSSPISTSLSPIDVSLVPLVSAPQTSNPSQASVLGIRAERIQLDRLGIDLRIVEGDGIDAPIGKAAHYPGSGWPGGRTNIYIYGHAQIGMFLTLWDVDVGDRVVLRLADGSDRTYIVATVIPKVPWDAVAYLGPTQAEQLTLQTSTSYYPTAPRFIVIAYPMA